MKPKRSSTKFLSIFALIAVIVFLSVLYFQFHVVNKLFGPADKGLSISQKVFYTITLFKHRDDLILEYPKLSSMEIKFQILENEPVANLCQRLEENSLVNSGELACDLLIYSGQDRSMVPGTYTIQNNWSVQQIVQKISDETSRDKILTIFAGWRLEEIANSIDQLDLSFTGEQFLQTALNPSDLQGSDFEFPQDASLEGFMASGSYSLEPDISLREFLVYSVALFFDQLNQENLLKRYSVLGITQIQAVTLASIIQRETGVVEEMPLIASVLFNRLNLGMRLEVDPSVQYALGYDENLQTWWTFPLSYSDLELESPYNTYQVQGIPPGPICVPSLDALRAVAFPAQTEYFFFRAKCDGSLSHNFAETYEEHLQNGCN